MTACISAPASDATRSCVVSERTFSWRDLRDGPVVSATKGAGEGGLLGGAVRVMAVLDDKVDSWRTHVGRDCIDICNAPVAKRAAQGIDNNIRAYFARPA
jgi:hypothetical protein